MAETETQPETATETAPETTETTKTEVITTKPVPRKRARKTTNESAEVIDEARTVPKHEAARGTVLYCECGAALMPDAQGMYPRRCPECGDVCDYRGVGFLEDSEDILVCAACGGLTKVKNDVIKCRWCGAE